MSGLSGMGQLPCAARGRALSPALKLHIKGFPLAILVSRVNGRPKPSVEKLTYDRRGFWVSVDF